ncbi:O-antigen ligase family protein [Acaryochloris sp. 'Moss Beach']|uniref:O-antigen ligase family protein n=1 Tax=Acaryochloris sp. 'Moss Beach' TaxID=2740837 RepID=UPI0028F40353|nr:O-antigen ligase family protein [Acaryochloris sp. 'Moss Beach']
MCLPLSLCIYAIFRSQRARLGSLWTGASAALLCASLGGITITELLNKPLEVFTSARPASSTDREFVVRKTLEAWQESPFIGWGVAQGTADWHTYSITLGSFSTYAAVLYLHGVVGFTFFLVALLSTLLNLWKLAIQDNSTAQKALGAVIALIIFMEAIPLSWMAVYFWFFFIWIGSILVELNNQNDELIKISHS